MNVRRAGRSHWRGGGSWAAWEPRGLASCETARRPPRETGIGTGVLGRKSLPSALLRRSKRQGDNPFGVIAPPSSQWRWLLTVPSHWIRRSAQRARRRDMAVALSMSDSDPVVAVASVARSLPGVGSHAKLSFCQLNSLAETLRPSLVAMPRRVSWISSRTGSHSVASVGRCLFLVQLTLTAARP